MVVVCILLPNQGKGLGKKRRKISTRMSPISAGNIMNFQTSKFYWTSRVFFKLILWFCLDQKYQQIHPPPYLYASNTLIAVIFFHLSSFCQVPKTIIVSIRLKSAQVRELISTTLTKKRKKIVKSPRN